MKDKIGGVILVIQKSYLSWNVQYLTPSLVKNSNPALSRRLALAMLLLPSSQGRTRVGNPNGSAPGRF